MKKVVLTLALLLAFSSIAFASPLADYSKGNTSFDINWRPNFNGTDKYTSAWSESSSYSTMNLSGNRRTYDWTVTTGLGNNFALQYSQYRPVGSTSYGYEYGMSTKELNVLYQLNKHVSAFAGVHRAHYVGETYTPNSDRLQVGFVGYDKIADKTTLYGILGAGNDLLNWETGVSYQVAPNLEVNFSYRYKKVSNLSDGYESANEYIDNVTARGFGYGVTYKF